MSVVCPTVLAQNPHDFRQQLERVSHFAERIQIDVADGRFASNKTVELKHLWWPENLLVDLHMMYLDPARELDRLLKLKPHLVIVHAEAEGNFAAMATTLRDAGIKVGVALLQKTSAESVKPVLDLVDHVLIFAGTLGHFGGHPDMRMLEKARAIRQWNPALEIGWDGGVSDLNIADIAAAGVDVFNVGGYIQHAADPSHAYAILNSLALGTQT